MTTQINSIQTQKSLLNHAKDEQILSLLTPQIQHYLSEFAKAGLQQGQLILVPGRAVKGENAMPNGLEAGDAVVRVMDKEGGEGEGGGMWFWKDEEMAKRLAAYLRPGPKPRAVAAEVSSRKEEGAGGSGGGSGRGFWGRLKGGGGKVEVKEEFKAARRPEESKADKIVMDVRAEEVVFRSENKFGLLETERGWAVVLTLKVVVARS